MYVLFLIGLTLCGVALLALGLSAHGAHRWAASTQALWVELEAGRIDAGRNNSDRIEADRNITGRIEARSASPAVPTRYDVRELDGLPAPVQRYFRAVLKDGQPIVTAVTIELAGTFNLSATAEQWKPFTSVQRVITRRPGFLWNADISMLPGLKVRVVDSYIAGKGLLHATVEGLITMADLRGDGDIARGELMRWFAEVAWYPTALLPSQGVIWDAVDERSANATMVDGPLTMTLLFRFNEAGLIDSFRAEARGSMVNKKLVMAPWEGSWSNYQTRDGMQVPFTGEVAWMRPEGRRSYFVGTVTSLNFEFSK